VLHKATPERLSAFSDGVFAVLITVLVPGAGKQVTDAAA